LCPTALPPDADDLGLHVDAESLEESVSELLVVVLSRMDHAAAIAEKGDDRPELDDLGTCAQDDGDLRVH
jgi:hypothetical protein